MTETHLSRAIAARQALRDAQPKTNCVAVFSGDIVEAEGTHRDALAAQGVTLGALHGLPIVVKDIIDVAGMPTKAGSATRQNPEPAEWDATVVAKLRAAGAITVAKTQTVEFAFGGWGTNASQGTPRNPWKENAHTPGGSSSGTGVAVGGGYVPAGLGTDTGGSVRIPAAFCGCVGLKTSIGLVSRAGVVALSDTFDTVGPLTDTVRRAAEMAEVMAGVDPADPSTLGAPALDFTGDIDRGISGLRFAVLSDEQLSDATAEVRAAFENALDLLREAGATTVPITLPRSFIEYQRICSGMISADAYGFHAALADSNEAPLNDTTRMRMTASRDLTARDRVQAQRTRIHDISDFLAVMDRADALILPTAPTTAIPLSKVDENDYSMSLYTRLANYMEAAALSVPSGLSEAGLPTSLQIVVRRFEDPLALRIGHAFEMARGQMPKPVV